MLTVQRILAAMAGAAMLVSSAALAGDFDQRQPLRLQQASGAIELGQRPFTLVEGMSEGPLKHRLAQCGNGPFYRSDFSIGHRGAPMRYPEHTLESYVAAARMGAGILECDVTFTRDRQLVCRHSQCDLHTTTNILQTDLAAKCSQGFIPYDANDIDRASGKPRPARARCCTSDITLAEFKTLEGRIDAANPRATTIEEYVSRETSGTWRGDAQSVRGTLLTHRESIRLFGKLGVGMTPELKSPSVPMPFEGSYTQQAYARQMIDEYRQAGVDPRRVWVQSFNLADVEYWIDNDPLFGRQAVLLDSRPYTETDFKPSLSDFEELRRRGVRIVAPPMFALLELDASGKIVPSGYARLARAAGLDIIAWTFERSDLSAGGAANRFYYRGIGSAISREGDKYLALDVLAQEVGVRGVFSDWPASVTYYANCMDL